MGVFASRSYILRNKDAIRELAVPKQNQIVIAIIAALAVIAGGVFYLNMAESPDNGTAETKTQDEALATVQPDASDGDPLETPNPLGELTLGDPAAPITIVEYSSLTCPHCAAFHTETLPALKEKYVDTGQVLIKFRPFPLDPYAMAGAMLAQCVSPVARVAFIDILFARQGMWIASADPSAELQKIAKQAGLSEDDYIVCLKDESVLAAIRGMQTAAAEQLNVRSTPTFFVNGQKLEGNQPLDVFEEIFIPLLPDTEN